ncbi:White-opaque regulator 1 [Madurella fahalii]|uniref:White-opaque regulator 1 n=1 Tax=Madurella fahalii TaxID=1157608 RepID=A0ABQ0G7D9_9PEZI
MVYGGKPSRGCRTCRARRIKCDEGKPTCKRCEKSKRECGGYRPEFEIVHRDQTGSTVRRMRNKAAAAAAKQQKQRGAGAHSFYLVQGQPAAQQQRSSPSPPPVLTVPIAQRASCYFASNFILVPLHVGANPHGFMEYLVPLIESEPAGSALRYAYNACAFALLGNRAKADGFDLARLSLKEHTLALAQTHKALGHPAMASTDATLAAVLMLCLYESITAIGESRMLAWRSHIDGAIDLVKTRGREQLCRTKTGYLLFTAVRHHLVSRTLSSVLPLPLGADWWMSAGDTDSLFATCQRFALKYTELRDGMTIIMVTAPRSPQTIARMHELAKRVQQTDRDLANWLMCVPDELRPRTLCWLWEDDLGLTRGERYRDVEVFPGPVDVYPDFMTASAWNLGRISRLLLASLSIRITAYICGTVDYRTAAEYETLNRICESVISEIIASVPYHLGWHLSRKDLLGNEPGRSGFACGQEGPYKALPSLFLIWSLTCIKNHDVSSEDQREWAKGRLKFIADHVGLKYAHIVREVNIRFPSMLIDKNGMMATPRPLQTPGKPELPLRPVATPRTPESLVSDKQSPSPG